MGITGNEPAMPIKEWPTKSENTRGGWADMDYCGLTIRQQFAMSAMQGICAHYSPSTETDVEIVAIRAVKMADALIKELNK